MSAEPTAAPKAGPLVRVAFASAALVALLLVAAIVVVYVAFDHQAAQVTKLERMGRTLRRDRLAFEATFARQSREIDRAVAAARAAYARGYRAGRNAAPTVPTLPGLEDYAARGFLVPRPVPAALGAQATIGRTPHGYNVRWPELAFYASRTEPLDAWLRQARSGPITGSIGSRRVTRIEINAASAAYVWREQSTTYGVVVPIDHELIVRDLVLSLD